MFALTREQVDWPDRDLFGVELLHWKDGHTPVPQVLDRAIRDLEELAVVSWKAYGKRLLNTSYAAPVSYTHLTLPTILRV